MATAASMASGSGEGKGRHHQDDIPSVVLLELWGHVADDDHRPDAPNATTATSTTSTGLTISVTLCAASPPGLSHLSVDYPVLDLGLDPSDKFVAPTVISTDADLVLLRVPVDRLARYDHSFSDYFVYRVHSHSESTKLYRLPSPGDRPFGDDNIAILSCGNDDDDDSCCYAVAALEPLYDVNFRLHLCRSTPDGKPGSWTFHQLTVEEPLRETVCPVPDSALRKIFHKTTKVITLGGAKGTVGWVDLWRGILLCDVLDESPKLRDMPLPLPSRGNWPLFLNRCPYYCRDIVVNQSRDTIKFVEMEFTMVDSCQDARSSYYKWVASQQCRGPQMDVLVSDGSWKVNTWNMPIPVTSWDDWKPGCSVTSNHIDTVLHSVMRKIDTYKGKAAMSVESLHTAYPTLSIADDDDVVYLLSKRNRRGSVKMVFTVNMRTRLLEGLVKLHSMSHFGFMRCFLSTGISKHLKPTGLQSQEDRIKLEQCAEVLKSTALHCHQQDACGGVLLGQDGVVL